MADLNGERGQRLAVIETAVRAALEAWGQHIPAPAVERIALEVDEALYDNGGRRQRPGEPVPPPKCQTCGDPLGGSPGNWFSLVTEREQCGEPFHYHEPVLNGGSGADHG